MSDVVSAHGPGVDHQHAAEPAAVQGQGRLLPERSGTYEKNAGLGDTVAVIP